MSAPWIAAGVVLAVAVPLLILAARFERRLYRLISGRQEAGAPCDDGKVWPDVTRR